MRTQPQSAVQMIGRDVIIANPPFSEKDSSDYDQKPSLPRNTPLAAPYGRVLKPWVEGLMTERMCSAHAEGCWGDGLKKHSSSLWPGKAAQGQLCGGGERWWG